MPLLALLTLTSHPHPTDIPAVVTLPHPLPAGIPTEQQYIEWYCQARGIPSPLATDWRFYLALSLFRLASILAGVGARAAQGNASSRIAAQVGVCGWLGVGGVAGWLAGWVGAGSRGPAESAACSKLFKGAVSPSLLPFWPSLMYRLGQSQWCAPWR